VFIKPSDEWPAGLLRFPVGLMAAAEPAILAQFEPVGRFLFVFLRVIVAALAFIARHHDHHAILFFCHICLTYMK